MPVFAALVAQLVADTSPCLASTPTLRRACAEDAPAVSFFLQGLSDASRRLRFHGGCNPQSQTAALRLCQVDGVRHQAWLAWVGSGADAVVVGEARFVVDADGGAGAVTAELAIAVADSWQGRGVADALMQQLLAAAARADVRNLYGDLLPGNTRMRVFMRRHGFDADLLADGDTLRLGRTLSPVQPPARGAVLRACSACLALLPALARRLAAQAPADTPAAVQP
jgi:acetyltransferase